MDIKNNYYFKNFEAINIVYSDYWDFNLIPDRIGDCLFYATNCKDSSKYDIVTDGFIYAVEFSPVSMRKLNNLCKNRPNIAPLLNDATKPKNYLNLVEKVDCVYCDVAQPNQSELFMKNMDLFLKDDGQGLIMVKARSIDVVQKPKKKFF